MSQSIDSIEPVGEPYEPPESLWQFIKSVANEKELDVIKRQIGESLVETSIDLHNEIDTLLEIWRDYRNETIVSLNQIKQNAQQKLPEPPNIRETLKKEICLFVKQMREQYKNDDSKFCKQIVANNHNLNVINYVLNTTELSGEHLYDLTGGRESSSSSTSRVERPKSSFSKQIGAETPVIPSSGRQSRSKIRYTSQSRSSSLSNLPSSYTPFIQSATQIGTTNQALDENLELLVDEGKINSMEIDNIVDNLRDLLQQECDTLMSDIEFLYECIDKESDYRLKSRQNLREPSLNELKDERKRLESDLLTSTGRNQVQISKLPSHVSATNSNRSIKSPILTNRITPSPPNSAASSARSIASTTSTATAATTKQSNPTPVSRTTTSNLKPVIVPKRSSSLTKPKIDTKSVLVPKKQVIPSSKTNTSHTNQLISSTGSSNADLKPILSRTSSAASSIDSLSLSVSSKASAVQKFRQMVLESRD